MINQITNYIYSINMRVEIPPSLDYEETSKKIVDELRNYLRKNGFDRAVMGLSGGLDSSTTLMLTVKAVGPENTYVYVMPSKATPRKSIDDAISMIKLAGIPETNWRKIDIEPIIKCYDGILNFEDNVIRGNTMARIRMSILYAEAKRLNAMVIGTGDKSELLIGYFTKYGDGGVDILPIGDIYKTQLRGLAKYLGIPDDIAFKPSSPELWVGHTAEGELGLSYERIDGILYLFYDLKKDVEEIEKYGYSRDEIDLVLNRYYKSMHKRSLPPIIKIST